MNGDDHLVIIFVNRDPIKAGMKQKEASTAAVFDPRKAPFAIVEEKPRRKRKSLNYFSPNDNHLWPSQYHQQGENLLNKFLGFF